MLRKRPLAVLVALVVFASACADADLTEPATTAPESGIAALTSGAGLDALTAEMPARHLVVVKKMDRSKLEDAVAELGGHVFFYHGPTGIAGVEGLDDAGAAELGAMGGVALVESEPILPMAEPVSMSEPEVAAGVASPADPSSASFFPRQWHLRAIHADQAWAAGRTGSPEVTVAILDTGIGYTHADLAGLVDLSRSVSFIASDDAYVNAYFPGAHPIADIGYHGTHVAATVASNGLAAAGVTSGVTLMGVKVCSVVSGGCPGLAIFQGIIHAVDNGADVANMSLGGWFTKGAYPGYVSTLNSLFNYAKQNDVTFVVSAGNESIDLDRNIVPLEVEEDVYEPTRIPSLFKTYCDATHVICVSATGPTASENPVAGAWMDVDAPAGYTNFGRSAVDVAAPGGTGAGWVTAACSPFSLVVSICQTGTFVIGLTGTSMASPHVSGLAALAVEDVGKSVSKVRAYITESADAIGGGNTMYYGKGRINVARAVGAM